MVDEDFDIINEAVFGGGDEVEDWVAELAGGDLTPDDMSFVITDQALDSDWENCS